MKLYTFLVFAFSFFVLYSNAEDSGETSEDEESYDIHPYGRPVSILKFDADGRFIVDNVTMDEMFMHPDVKDRKIVAVSIIGAFRKGKSFLMDYALRYMYGNYKSVKYPDNPLNNTKNWMGEPNEPLKGFSWRGGTGRDTTGVIMWSDIFLHETEESKQLAIILLDTQGLFDTKTTPTDNSRIFALGTLASSIQIFNLNDVIQENQLEYLQLATEFSKFALKKNKENKKRAKPFKPFQNLIFLMRDWQNKYDYKYGLVGGASYLAGVLQVHNDQPEPLRNVRNFIKSSFEKLDCFLMPHPGANVTTDRDYEGQRSGLDKDFEQQLGDFLTYILEPSNLVAKRILDKEVSAADYAEYLKAYFIAFESDDIPRVETLHTITIRKQYDILVADALKTFKDELKSQSPDYYSPTFSEEMDEIGNKATTKAIEKFNKKRKLGSPDDEKQFMQVLKNLIEVKLSEWKLGNIKTYNELKRVEEEKRRQLEEAERLAQERLEEQKRLAEEERKKLEELQKQRERELNENLEAIREESRKQLANSTAQYEEEKARNAEENKFILKQYSKQNDEMRKQVAENENRLHREIIEMKQKMLERSKELERLLQEKQTSKLEELNIQRDQKRLELEQQLKIVELKQKAEIERQRFDKEWRLEELRIREESERERKLGTEKMIQEMRQEQKRMQQLLLNSFRNG